jgi:hypothetical protein
LAEIKKHEIVKVDVVCEETLNDSTLQSLAKACAEALQVQWEKLSQQSKATRINHVLLGLKTPRLIIFGSTVPQQAQQDRAASAACFQNARMPWSFVRLDDDSKWVVQSFILEQVHRFSTNGGMNDDDKDPISIDLFYFSPGGLAWYQAWLQYDKKSVAWKKLDSPPRHLFFSSDAERSGPKKSQENAMVYAMVGPTDPKIATSMDITRQISALYRQK